MWWIHYRHGVLVYCDDEDDDVGDAGGHVGDDAGEDGVGDADETAGRHLSPRQVHVPGKIMSLREELPRKETTVDVI